MLIVFPVIFVDHWRCSWLDLHQAETIHDGIPIIPGLLRRQRFAPVETDDLLNLSHHPSIGPNRTLFEGWRQVLLPLLLSTSESHRLDCPTVFVAEDDVRLCNVCPGRIREVKFRWYLIPTRTAHLFRGACVCPREV